MSDLISIVLPVYNGEKYLRESIDSILSQTYQNWELLILDDCSSDGTAAIADEYVKKDNRIKYYLNKTNLKLPANLNKGFSLAKGDFLTWTSDDNRYHPTAIEKLYENLKKNQTDFVFASCNIINEIGEQIEYIMVNQMSKKCIVGSNPVGACFMYTRKVYESVGDYDPDLVLVEDFDYWQRICANFGFSVISEILYDYRWHDGALTSTMKQTTFYENLEKTLLKNRPSFGKLDYIGNYFYYQGLYDCREKSGKNKNPYRFKFNHYKFMYFIGYRARKKIKKLLGENI